MLSTVIDMKTRFAAPSSSGDLPTDGGGPTMTDMEQRLTAVETTLKFLATKEDVTRVEGTVHKTKNEMVMWGVGIAIALAALIINATSGKAPPPAAPTSPVVVITTPGAATAAPTPPVKP